MIDQSRVADGFLFATHRDRCLYLGKSVDDRPRWLRDNVGRWRRVEDVGQEDAPSTPPVEAEMDLGAGPAEPADSSSSPDVRNDGDDEDDVALVGAPTGDCSSPHEPTSLPTPVTAIIKKRTSSDGAKTTMDIGQSASDERAALLAAAEAALTGEVLAAPNDAWAHCLLGHVQIFSNRAAQGIAECERALALDRNLALAHAQIGHAKYFIGRAEETEAHIERAFRLSPYSSAEYRLA